jgi:hypothetical protein
VERQAGHKGQKGLDSMGPWHADDSNPSHYDSGVVWWVVRDNEGNQYIGYRNTNGNARLQRIVSASTLVYVVREGDQVRVHRDGQSRRPLAVSVNHGPWTDTARRES